MNFENFGNFIFAVRRFTFFRKPTDVGQFLEKNRPKIWPKHVFFTDTE